MENNHLRPGHCYDFFSFTKKKLVSSQWSLDFLKSQELRMKNRRLTETIKKWQFFALGVKNCYKVNTT